MVRLSFAFTVAVAAVLRAQSPGYEAIVTPNNGGSSEHVQYPGLGNGRLFGHNCSLRLLLGVAYGLSENRIIGPDLLDDNRFDLQGEVPPGVPDTGLMRLLQALLKDRLKVAVHREMKEMPVFDMVVAEGGLKMPLTDRAHPFIAPHHPDPPGSVKEGTGTMPQIAKSLSKAAGRPIVDMTGLEGSYGYTVVYTQPPRKAGGSNPPDLLTAVEQQLGLKLEPKNETIEVLVVDHAEPTPAEN